MLIDNHPEFGGIRSYNVAHLIVPVKLRKPDRPARRAVKGASLDNSIHGNTADSSKISAPNFGGKSVRRAFVDPVGARSIGPEFRFGELRFVGIIKIVGRKAHPTPAPRIHDVAKHWVGHAFVAVIAGIEYPCE